MAAFTTLVDIHHEREDSPLEQEEGLLLDFTAGPFVIRQSPVRNLTATKCTHCMWEILRMKKGVLMNHLLAMPILRHSASGLRQPIHNDDEEDDKYNRLTSRLKAVERDIQAFHYNAVRQDVLRYYIDRKCQRTKCL